MTAYADVEQLAARWRPLSDDETETAEVLLEDAAVQIRQEIPGLTARIEAGDADLLAATIRVECAMVKRAMSVAAEAYGVTSTQETQGPFSRTFQYSNPMGDMYLTKAEKRILGSGGQSAYGIDMAGTTTGLGLFDELALLRLRSAQTRLSGFE